MFLSLQRNPISLNGIIAPVTLETASASWVQLKSEIKSMEVLTSGDVITVELWGRGHIGYRSIIIVQKDALVEISVQKCDHIVTEYRFTEREENNVELTKLPDEWRFVKKYNFFQCAVEMKVFS